MELRAVSHWGHCPTTRALPPSPRVKGMLGIVQAMTQLTCLAASCHCGLLCPYFSDISGIHTIFEINHEPYIYIIKTKYFGKSCRETYVISAGFDEYSVCVYLSSSIVSPGHWLCLFSKKQHAIFQVLTVPNNQVIVNLNITSCFFCGEVLYGSFKFMVQMNSLLFVWYGGCGLFCVCVRGGLFLFVCSIFFLNLVHLQL